MFRKLRQKRSQKEKKSEIVLYKGRTLDLFDVQCTVISVEITVKTKIVFWFCCKLPFFKLTFYIESNCSPGLLWQ